MEFVKKYDRDKKRRDAQFARLISVTNYIKNKRRPIWASLHINYVNINGFKPPRSHPYQASNLQL